MPKELSDLKDIPHFKGVLCDIDDTLTHNGQIVPEAFLALHRLKANGIRVVPITGRPGGWVDHIARMWPVDGVVGENGGLWYWFDGNKLQRRFAQPQKVRKKNKVLLKTLGTVILSEVPSAALASDQPYRELDLAIDFCEDVPPLEEDDISKIVECFLKAGATCKVSSIHVNGWYGDFDKLAGFIQFHQDRWGEEANPSEWVFFGDSANDEPMFKAFEWSVGVRNVEHFLPKLSHPPKWITPSQGGTGFAEGIRAFFKHIDP